jgi:predicted adenine nucleotide alpha hydrolase (AANH) superfamily ATPase
MATLTIQYDELQQKLEWEREQLKQSLPDDLRNGASKGILLHSCCAPCSGSMIKELVDLGLAVTILWYNPNIHPKKEYEIRKEENLKYAIKLGIPFVDLDYDVEEWYKRAMGLDYEPERGSRCTMCFDMRMERTALYAHENGFHYITTTNATSRWKDVKQVNESGIRAAGKYPDVHFWEYNWQTDQMTQRKYEISASERFYKQEYCGCSFSLRDSNIYRRENGIPPVKIGGEEAGHGPRYFSDPVVDAEEEKQEVVDAFFQSATAPVAFGDERRQMYAERKKCQSVEGTAPAPVAAVGSTAEASLQTDKKISLSALNNW